MIRKRHSGQKFNKMEQEKVCLYIRLKNKLHCLGKFSAHCSYTIKLHSHPAHQFHESNLKRVSRIIKDNQNNFRPEKSLTYTTNHQIVLILPFSNHVDLIKYLVKHSSNLLFIVAILHHQQSGTEKFQY